MFPYYCMARSLRRQADQTLGVYNIACTQQNGAKGRGIVYIQIYSIIFLLFYFMVSERGYQNCQVHIFQS